ncbi:MAG: isochorismatase family protein [Nitrospinota bacterium]|nr:isochorismatase family protein [Nitrospinota bacterium]
MPHKEIQNLRLVPDDCVLVIVDVQERLMSSMEEKIKELVLRNISILIQVAHHLEIPILLTEQYPKGLGKTLNEINSLSSGLIPLEKISFSCMGSDEFTKRIRNLKRTKVLLTGVETHVCCYQTGLDLLESGFIVYTITDATCSRKKNNWKIALASFRDAGACLSSTEQAVFDLIRVAGTNDFKFISSLVK